MTDMLKKVAFALDAYGLRVQGWTEDAIKRALASGMPPSDFSLSNAQAALRDERDALKHDIGQYVKANADLHEDKDKAEARAEQAESENEGLHKLVDHYRAENAKAERERDEWQELATGLLDCVDTQAYSHDSFESFKTQIKEKV